MRGRQSWRLCALLSGCCVLVHLMGEPSFADIPPLSSRDAEQSLEGGDAYVAPVEDVWIWPVFPAQCSEKDSCVPMPLLMLDGFSDASLVVVLDPPTEVETTDVDGRPLRWVGGESSVLLLEKRKVPRNIGRPARADLHFQPLRRLGASRGVLVYGPLVRRYADTYRVSQALLFAIMQAESLGRPRTVSRANAVGLMQVQPHTAARDVEEMLRRRGGDAGAATTEDLLSPERSIHYGAAYLHVLESRYFGRVRDPRARQMCVIAAYNAGPGRVLRQFGASMKDAVHAINGFTPESLYSEMKVRLPHAETRRYLDKVFSLVQLYSGMGY